MMKRKSWILITTITLATVIALVIFKKSSPEGIYDVPATEEPSAFEQKHRMLPEERYKIRQEQTYRAEGPNYKPGYVQKELMALRSRSTNARQLITQLDDRGPANVPGRARGLIVLPQDESHNTWLVGSSGGGVWKTIDGGITWEDKSDNFPTLAVTSLAFCQSQPDIIYAGTGEYVASAYTAINGDGIFKSEDAGETWTQLQATAGNDLWQSVTRVIVDPDNPDIVLASTAPNTWGPYTSNIFKSTDGGQTWTSVFAASSGAIEQIIADPKNFNRIYACQNGVGVLISDDAGDSWQSPGLGMAPSSRIEIAVSPVNSDRLYASVVGGQDASQEADIYYSDDAGKNWILILDDNSTVDVLRGQGWYDNTILAHPFNLNDFYIGGIGIFKYTLDVDAGVTQSAAGYRGVSTGGTEAFMDRVNFSAELDGGRVALGSADPSKFSSVELRFGPGRKQMAHRFTVPEGRGAGVADNEYTYQDYVEVPFEAWDVDSDPPRQLMVSFRDQQRDQVFNLIYNNTEGGTEDPDHLHSREYVYINSEDYSTTASANIAKDGGHVSDDLFFIWPFLVEGATWDPDNLPQSEFRIEWGAIQSGKYDVASIVDPYGDVDNKNSDVHPDQHFLVSVIADSTAKTWQLVNVNDGGPFVSEIATDPGFSDNSWSMVGETMNTTQFYGADKAPGVNRYVGGTQDNGSWVSPADEDASTTTKWRSAWGGDGFDAVWHPTDIDQIIVTSQNLGVAKSENGGQSFSGSTTGLPSDDNLLPFIGQFANAPQFPDEIYTVAGDGVYKSENFGDNWRRVSDLSTTGLWVNSSLISIEINEATPDIVWAGGGMTPGSAALFVSKDRGASFEAVNASDLNDGIITGIGTNPHNYKVVYALFSYADSPKILRSNDLGETWEDISGFASGSQSVGFPDVAVYDIQVMPHDANTIWVGTEVGIVESNDNGASWHLLQTNMPQASVWEIQHEEDQLVIATHARGVWTYTLPQVPELTYYPEPTRLEFGLDGSKIALAYEFPSDYDSVQVYVEDEYAGTVLSPTVGVGETLLEGLTLEGSSIKAYMVGYKNGASYTSDEVVGIKASFSAAQSSYVDMLDKDAGNFVGDLGINVVPGFDGRAIHTRHDYKNNSDLYFTLKIPIIVKSSEATLDYKDIAIVEPGADFVELQASTDGINWSTIVKYDASFNAQWESAYNGGANGTPNMYVEHSYNLLDFFDAGDEVVLRFHFMSNQENTAWGWAVDDLAIQGELIVLSSATTSVAIYPNPAADFITINHSLSGIENLRVVDLNGREYPVKLMENNLDVRALSKGLYVLSFQQDGVSYTQRFIKN